MRLTCSPSCVRMEMGRALEAVLRIARDRRRMAIWERLVARRSGGRSRQPSGENVLASRSALGARVERQQLECGPPTDKDLSG